MTAPAYCCDPEWRVEVADLRSGRVLTALRPVSFDAQRILNKTGTGSILLHPADIKNLRYVWPHLTSIWFTYRGELVWPGYITALSLQQGALQLGLTTLDDYLYRRLIRETLQFGSAPTEDDPGVYVDQTAIGAALVNVANAAGGGIPINGAYEPSAHKYTRTFLGYDRQNVGEQISQLCELDNGPDYLLSGSRDGGQWTVTVTFKDYAGVERNTVLIGDVDAPDYGLEIDTADHATRVDAIGSGSDEQKLIAEAVETSPRYVWFDEAPAFLSITDIELLKAQAVGYLEQHREPWVTPRLQLTPDLHTGDAQLGDTITARMCFSGIGYTGRARIVGDTFRAGPESPTTRELLLEPLSRASDAMLDQPACDPCPDCGGA